jgi:hypothetical protein
VNRLAVLTSITVGAVLGVASSACDVLKPPPDARYPRQAAGCDVVVFPDGPKVIADNIGSVRAECDERTTDEECLRQLEDEVCKLGGDIAWGVPAKAKDIGGGQRVLEARAAHTHIPAGATPRLH